MSKGNLLGAFMCGTGRRIMTAFVAVSAIAAVAGSSARAEDIPTPEEYAAHVGGDATIIAPGALKLDNQSMVCGQRPTVLDSQLDDYGAAYPGFLILNPRLLAKISTPVKMCSMPTSAATSSAGPTRRLPIASRSSGVAARVGSRPKVLMKSAGSFHPPKAIACILRALTVARTCAVATKTCRSASAG